MLIWTIENRQEFHCKKIVEIRHERYCETLVYTLPYDFCQVELYTWDNKGPVLRFAPLPWHSEKYFGLNVEGYKSENVTLASVCAMPGTESCVIERFPKDMLQNERDRLMQLSEDLDLDSLQADEEGWVIIEDSLWIWGDLEIHDPDGDLVEIFLPSAQIHNPYPNLWKYKKPKISLLSKTQIISEDEISQNWLIRRVSLADVEETNSVLDERLGPLPVPFGFMNNVWEKTIISEMLSDDELWEFSSPDDSWKHMCGRSGCALVRNGKIVAYMVTSMN